MNESNEKAARPNGFVGLLTGGWKRWLLLAPLSVVLLMAIVYFGQPVLAAAWRFMPVLLFAAACGMGFFCTRMTTRLKIFTSVVSVILVAWLVWTCGIAVVPILVMCSIAGLLMAFSPSGFLAVASKAVVVLIGL